VKAKKKNIKKAKYPIEIDSPIIVEYQEWVKQMWKGNPKAKYTLKDKFIMTAGLGGETGEVLEILKKSERDGKLDLEHLTEELGDVLYYLTMICNYHNINLIDVIQGNVEKINFRYAKHLK